MFNLIFLKNLIYLFIIIIILNILNLTFMETKKLNTLFPTEVINEYFNILL